MRVVFMGTPDFAAEILEKLIEKGHDVAAVVTQPDRARGRSGAPVMSPVKATALKHNIVVYQPERIRKNEEFYNEMALLKPDVIVVAAFGQILPDSILQLPEYGCINVHASLLPAYRGAAPIQWAVIDGLDETGVTIMQMDAGIDTGDIIMQTRVRLDKKETGGSLFDKLSKEGARLLVEALDAVQDGRAVRVRQDDSRSSYAKILTRESGIIDFSKDACCIERLIRGLNPWPSAYTKLGGKILKIWDADVTGYDEEKYGALECGTVFNVTGDSFSVRCGKDALIIRELQLEGRKRMACDAFMRGLRIECGTLLGEDAQTRFGNNGG